jgi:four helix bundle protein
MTRAKTTQPKARVLNHRQLEVYTRAFDLSMQVFELSREFPREEVYSLTDQIRRSTRSVSSNLAEAWRKRRYLHAFIAKLSDAEAEAAESQTWLEYAVKCGYMDRTVAAKIYKDYDKIIGTLVGMIIHADDWLLPTPTRTTKVRAS